MELSKEKELEKFLIDLKKKGITSRADIYDMLRFYGLKDSDKVGKKSREVLEFFNKWSSKYKDTFFKKHNYEILQFSNQDFWGIKSKNNDSNNKEWLEIYLAVDYNHLDKTVDQLIKFLDSNKDFEYDMKVSKIITSDSIVIRVKDDDMASKVINFINSSKYITEGKNKQNPFVPSINNVGKIVGNDNSYNNYIATILEDYLKKNLIINYESFVEFLKGQLPHSYYLSTMENYFGYKNCYGIESIPKNVDNPSQNIINHNKGEHNLFIDNAWKIKNITLFQACCETLVQHERFGENFGSVRVNYAIRKLIEEKSYNYFTSHNDARLNLMRTVLPREVDKVIMMTVGVDYDDGYNMDQLISEYVDMVSESVYRNQNKRVSGRGR